jgi:hypothetical protein
MLKHLVLHCKFDFWFDLIEHFYSAHIHSIECSWRLADVLACSQKVSHPEMRLVSAAIGASFQFPFENFGACWFLYVSTISWLTHRNCRIFIVRAWCSECVHTLDLGLSSHWSEGRESHQPQVIWASHTNSKILVPDKARTLNLSHWSRARYRCATGAPIIDVSHFVSMYK